MDVFYYYKDFDKSDILTNFRESVFKKDKDKAASEFLKFMYDDKNFVFDVEFYQAISLKCIGYLDISFRTRQTVEYVAGYNVEVSESSHKANISPEYRKRKVEFDRIAYQRFEETCLMESKMATAYDINSYERSYIDKKNFATRNTYQKPIPFCELNLNFSLAEKIADACVSRTVHESSFDLSSGEKVLSTKVKVDVRDYDDDSFCAYIFAKYKISFVYEGKTYTYLTDEHGAFAEVDFFIYDKEKLKEELEKIENECMEDLKVSKHNFRKRAPLVPISIITFIYTLVRILWYKAHDAEMEVNATIDSLLSYGILPAIISASVFVFLSIKFCKSDIWCINSVSSDLNEARLAFRKNDLPQYKSYVWKIRFPIEVLLLTIIPIAYIVLSYFV